MEIRDAATLIAPAIETTDTTWADLGAGSGTFTRALASLLQPGARVIAVERDAAAVTALRAVAERTNHGVEIRAVRADFTKALDVPPLDGALVANALHYVPYVEQARVLGAIAQRLAENGRLVVVEYENRAANRWVPYPITYDGLVEQLARAGVHDVARIGERASRFGGTMYAAVARAPKEER